MMTPAEFSAHVKTLFRRNGSLTTGSRLKILAAIHQQNDADFSDIDIYRVLQEENQKVSISTINKNLKGLRQMGLLVSSKTNLAATVYKKSVNFKKLLSCKFALLPYQIFSMDNYLFACFCH